MAYKNNITIIVSLLRIKHYVKNLLVFCPLFFNRQIMNTYLFNRALGAFIAFCLISSFIYIINDIKDIEKDRIHPVKRNRPLAAGLISVSAAYLLAFILGVSAALILFRMNSPWMVYMYCMFYVFINIVYSFGGKNVPVLDVAILSSGYPVRVLIGGVITGIEVSSWLFLTILCLSLYLALGKRRGELKRSEIVEGNTRPVLEQYELNFLDGHMYLCLGLGIVFYSLWSIEKSMQFVFSVPLVLLICIHYNFVMYTKTDGDPVTTLFSSKALMLLILLYGAVLFSILYLA